MDRNIIKIDAEKQLKSRIRVCAYARVSRDKDAMFQSLSAQVSHYNKMINSNPEWQFKGVYADYAFSGTKEDRPEFQKMLEACKAGEIDLIITKSISRFARNTETVLKVVRELKARDVDVYFEEQKIHTISSDGEFMLSVLAAYYQEEARSVSENMKWRIKKDFSQGIMWGGKDNYGYKYDIDKKTFIVVPEEAAVVKRIFELYIAGAGFQKIASILNSEGIKPMTANEWSKNNVTAVISNSNYTGDLILQKTYRKDYLSKKKCKNNGELQKYLVEENHEPIITKEMFEKAQEIRNERIMKYDIKTRKAKNNYPFTGILRCGCCGGAYHHKTTRYNLIWICRTYNTKGKGFCSRSKQIDERKLYDAINQYFGWDKFKQDKFLEKVEKIIANPGNELEIHLKDGTVDIIYWNDRSRSEAWTDDMKSKARAKAFKQNELRGGNNRWQKSK